MIIQHDATKTCGEVQSQHDAFLTSVSYGGEWFSFVHCPLYPCERPTVPWHRSNSVFKHPVACYIKTSMYNTVRQ
jgi:hypothetical protein